MKGWQVVRLILASVLIFMLFQSIKGALHETTPPEHVTFTQLTQMIETNPKSIKELDFYNGDDKVTLKREGKEPVDVSIPDKGGGELLVKEATAKNVPIEVKLRQTGWIDIIAGALGWILPLGLLLLFFSWSSRQQGRQISAVTKAGVQIIMPGQGSKTFADVAGCDEAKEELQEIVYFLKNPRELADLGGRIPRGILLLGAPGTGKTLLAKALAGEAGVPFITMSGSGFVEMFVGVGAGRVRNLVEVAIAHKPCIIFLDEVDAVGRRRGTGIGGGHDEREQTLNQLLVAMDGMETDPEVIWLAATNRADVLDPALLRPGRFDRQVVVDYPDLKGRIEILKIHASQKKLEPGFDLRRLAVVTPGYTGAELENTMNEAAAVAHRRHIKEIAQLKAQNKSDSEIAALVPRVITMADAAEGAERVKNGAARTSRAQAMTEEEKRNTAKHELGHALIGSLLKGGDEVTKITIMPRGRSLGATYSMPPGDRFSYTRDQAIARIMMACGGRAAQKVLDGVIDTGASNDFAQANDIAHNMVAVWGMDEEVGWLSVQDNRDEPFLGRSMAGSPAMGPAQADLIDRRKNCIMREAMRATEALIEQYKDFLLKETEKLVAQETLMGADWYRDLEDHDIKVHQLVPSIDCGPVHNPLPPIHRRSLNGDDDGEEGCCGGRKSQVKPESLQAPPAAPEARQTPDAAATTQPKDTAEEQPPAAPDAPHSPPAP